MRACVDICACVFVCVRVCACLLCVLSPQMISQTNLVKLFSCTDALSLCFEVLLMECRRVKQERHILIW